MTDQKLRTNPLRLGRLSVAAVVFSAVRLSERCCGESGTLAVARPDISTQVRFRKQEEIEKGAARLRADSALGKAHDPQVGAGNTAIAAIAATTVTTTTTATTATTAIAPSNPVTPAVLYPAELWAR